MEQVKMTDAEIKQETPANLAPQNAPDWTPPKLEEKDAQNLHDIEIKQPEKDELKYSTEERLPVLRKKMTDFCEGIISGKTQAKSFLDAHYHAKNEHAAGVLAQRLLANADIKRYIEIRQNQQAEELRKKTQVTLESINAEYQDIINICKEKRDETTWQKLRRETVESQAKLHGLITEKIKVDQPIILSDIHKLHNKDRKNLLQQLEEKLPTRAN